MFAVLGMSPVWGQTTEIVGRPQVNEDEIILRVRVTEDGERPAMWLEEEDFQVVVDGDSTIEFSATSPDETEPPPAWIVVLMDMSGSMNQNDRSGRRKLDGAIAATRGFVEEISDRGENTKIAILPFGEGRGTCQGYEVTEAAINQRFFPASDFKQQNILDRLASQTPCASTNIYDPLSTAIRLLGDEDDRRFYLPDDLPEDSTEPEPRLSVILLSDGYHNRDFEERDFAALVDLLKRHDNIVVHTLGYGLTTAELGEKYKLGRPATRADIQSKTKPDNPVPDEEFVDEERLREIAEASGGIAEFSAQADEISEALQLFLNALLGEYEIVYIEPNAERGSTHEVKVQATVNGEEIQTKGKSYIIQVFGREVSRGTRLTMTVVVLMLLGFGGVLPFWKWSHWLKEQAEEDF
ncbi:MAG: vWA domain-containing protein [Baaleninema sp.]